jgi:bifunctional oligoribonuclease and PAP phosphatase NrnA
MQKFKAFKELISSPKKIVITTHHKPDADALGSSLGLAGYLKKLHHQVTVITPSDYPKFLEWMPGNEEVLVYDEKQHNKVARLCLEADIIFCLDFSCLNRINEVGELVRESNAIKVLIDHHLEPEHFADFEFWDITAAATAEIVYELIIKMGGSKGLDAGIAECLYAGIMTDTGSFRHPNTTAKIHNIVAELIQIGANTAKVAKLIYDNNSLNRLKFIGFALSEKLVVLKEYKTAYFSISSKELDRYNSRTGDTEGLVNYALSLEGIVMAEVNIERDEAVKLSFRSV